MKWRRGPTIQVPRSCYSCAILLHRCVDDTAGTRDPPSCTAAVIEQSHPIECMHWPLTALCAPAAGHYTIEACNTSQYEQHMRAVLGWPLGSPALKVHRGREGSNAGLGG